MRGRKPKPTHLKLVMGRPRSRKLNKNEVKPRACIPIPPSHLDDRAAAEWHRVAPELYGLGLLTNLDVGVLAAYCVSYSRAVMGERLLAEMARADPDTNGLLIRAGNSTLIPNPLIGIVNRSQNDMVRFAAELGLTPCSRSRIDVKPENRPSEPADEYFQ